jgi:heme-degrading monooxygenase HmoA
VLAVTRFRVTEAGDDGFLDEARAALEVLSERPGFVRGYLGRCTDDTSLWVLSTEWQGVGAYRRALSSYDVKMRATAALQRALQEPSAFEVIESASGGDRGSALPDRATDAGTAGPGRRFDE